jgi:hypothetical protein
MDPSDEDSTPLTEAFLEAGEEAFTDPPVDPDGRRDPGWLRWVKFGSIILFPAIVLGLGFLFGPYFTKYNTRTHYEESRDTVRGMRFRFFVGASVGGGIGLIYVVRCLVRRTDP